MEIALKLGAFFAEKCSAFYSWFSEVVDDEAYLARGEDFVGGGVAGGFELFVEVGASAYPAHEVVHGGARVALGEIEPCEGALGVGSDLESIHGCVFFFE